MKLGSWFEAIVCGVQSTVVGLSTRPAILIDFQKLFLHNVSIRTKMYRRP